MKTIVRSFVMGTLAAASALAVSACAAETGTEPDMQPAPATSVQEPTHPDMALGGGTTVKDCVKTSTGGEWVCNGGTLCCTYCVGTYCGSCVLCY